MDFNQKSLLEAILAGQSADELAKKFSEALNGAIAEQQKIEASRKEKRTAAAEVLNAFFNFGEKYYSDIFGSGSRKLISVDDFIQLFDELAKESASVIDNFEKGLKTLSNKDLAKIAKVFDITAEKIAADPLTDFLKSNNLF